jgi:hypothetical protein
VDADFSDLFIIIGQAGGLDLLWMQIFRGFYSSIVRPLDWIFCGYILHG